MEMKKLASLLLAAVMLAVMLPGCSGKKADTFTVGICQLAQHEALDAATQGFCDALKKEFGDKVKFELQNASGEPANCATIINSFLSNNVDLILANATSPLQAAASATKDVPILGT